MHYVGMDCHITTLGFAVVNDAGRPVKSCKVNTRAKNLLHWDFVLDKLFRFDDFETSWD
jgi:hypothetical protein